MIIKKKETDFQTLYKQLNDSNRETLYRFAQFLVTIEQEQSVVPPAKPLNIPPSPGENVIQALKRLKKTYPMIDTDIRLLDAASQLVLQKVLGVPDTELIERMEKLFTDAYQAWQADNGPGQ
ncbi:MAG: Crp/Fnr family transcriptional regulator [Magnetococcales bacterium]|nr:Crp/Fnr family transcriptional regulator [Magnetococcales bacterium]